MEPFPADMFFNVTHWLERVRRTLEIEGDVSDKPSLDADSAKLMKDMLLSFRPVCVNCELPAATQNLDYLIAKLDADVRDMGLHERAALNEGVKMLQAAVEAELGKRVFIFVPPTDAKWLEPALVFDIDLARAFPSAATDLAEAGRCYALGRYTASVFHAMCALEPALASLAKKLKVEPGRKPWGPILDDINGRIAALSTRKRKSTARTKELEFLSGAVEHFKWVKDAYRNHTMHGRASYDRGTALSVLEHVPRLMEHLAKNGLEE